MNIIYRLVNLNKETGRRFYIGSKQECCISKVDGVNRIVSLKSGLPYYGSSTCIEMKSDMETGHEFEAELLEEVYDKANLFDRENFYIRKFNAVSSEDYYNKREAFRGSHTIDQHAMFNKYGETILAYGKITSSFNKKNNTAKRFGFKNLGEMCVFIHKQQLSGKSSAVIADMIGWERHQPARYVKPYNMVKCLEEFDSSDKEVKSKLVKLYSEGVSINKISEITGFEIPTVIMHVHEYDVSDKGFLVASRMGKSKEELEIEITLKVLQGDSYSSVCKLFSIDETSAKRYFMNCVKRNLKDVKLF
jgi:hypothetical protein